MIDYKIIDNALSRKDFLKIKEMMTDQYFTWNVINTVANNSEQMPNPASYYFIHMFWEGLYTTDEVSVFIPGNVRGKSIDESKRKFISIYR